MIAIILITALGIVLVAVLVGLSSRPPPTGDSDDDNDLTGSNANFGKSLMGDNDNFGKGF